ncbi:MAG: FAD-dependent oxidoreductase [Acidobacteria bacterium]|nr:FAD-dependent oxidoreductase [Acidobacteriota bacterium]
MTRDLALLAGKRFDVLVIGGGIHGLAVAYDAAQRGYSVALVDRGDFGGASSFNHAKTVHGGLRSLQTGDVVKARFSLRERRAMARIAPHLVTPLSFVMATTRKLTRSTWALRAGFALDAAIGFDRNAGVRHSLRLAAGTVISKAAYAEVFGPNASPSATGAARWNDYQMAESDRLTLAFAQAAGAYGAVLANYLAASGPLLEGRRVRGITARDGVTGAAFEIEAGITVNAAGAHGRSWLERLGASVSYPLLKAMNLVTSRPAGTLAMGAPTSGGRLLLIMPWRGRMLIGTSHSNDAVQPDDGAVSPAELSAFVAEVNSAFPSLQLTPADVTLVHRGVVPAEADAHGMLALMGHHRVYDHALDGLDGAISVVGVKYTTARGVGEQVVNLIGRKLGRTTPPCATGVTLLPGAYPGVPADEIERAVSGSDSVLEPGAAASFVATHGSAWQDIATLCRTEPELARPIGGGIALPAAVIVHAVRHEMACTLADVVLRRTSIGSAGHPGDAAVAACAAVMAETCRWDEARVAREVAAVTAFYAPVGE